MVLRNPDSHKQKNETESLSYTIHKNQLNSKWLEGLTKIEAISYLTVTPETIRAETPR